MLIKPFRKYIVLCKGKDQKKYQWCLRVEPWYQAWKVVNEDISVGLIYKDHLILSIDDVTPNYVINNSYPEKHEDLEFREEYITEDEFNLAVYQSGIGYAVPPSPGQSFRCDFCGGVVASDICTQCMFDWDC